MKPLGRYFVLLPVALATVSFVLSMLGIFAGHKPGFMEDYAVVRLNTSMVGHNVINKIFPGKDEKKKDGDKKEDKKTGGGLLGDVQGWLGDKTDDAKDKIGDVAGDAKDKINDVTGKISDKIAKRLGISEWYSLHIMDACQGNYAPNSTAPNIELNVTKCSSGNPAQRLNLTGMLDKELKVGPAKLNLADIKWPDAIQDAIDVLNKALLGIFIVFNLHVGLAALSALGGLLSLWKPDARLLSLINLTIAGLAFLCSLIASIIMSIATNSGVKTVNKVGNVVGLYAYRGDKFYAMSWVATTFMGVVALFWMIHICTAKRRRARFAKQG